VSPEGDERKRGGNPRQLLTVPLLGKPHDATRALTKQAAA